MSALQDKALAYASTIVDAALRARRASALVQGEFGLLVAASRQRMAASNACIFKFSLL
jgi:hypothetical protein